MAKLLRVINKLPGGSSICFRALLFAALAAGSSLGHAIPLPPAARPFIQKLANLSSYDLPTMISQGLVAEGAPGVYHFLAGRDYYEHESLAARQLAATTGQPVLLFGWLPGIMDMPGFDLILFNNAGQPTHNVSIKSIFERVPRGLEMDAMERRIRDARENIERWYFPGQLETLYESPLTVRAVRGLLGLVGGAVRPAVIVVDVLGRMAWKPTLRTGGRGGEREDFLQVTRWGEISAAYFSLRSLVAAQVEAVFGIYFLFPQATVMASRRGAMIKWAASPSAPVLAPASSAEPTGRRGRERTTELRSCSAVFSIVASAAAGMR